MTALFRIGMLLLAIVATPCAIAADIVLPGERVFPGGVASMRDGTLFVGSMRDGAIWKIAPGGSLIEQLPLAVGEISSLTIDERTQTLWACAGSLNADNPAAVLKAIDLRSNKVRSEFVLPAQGHCSDVGLGRDGTLYVVDGANSALLRMKKGESAPVTWLSNDDVGRSLGNWSSVCTDNVGGLYILSRDKGSLVRITVRWDGSASKPVEIKLDRPLVKPATVRLMAKRKLLVTEASGQLSRVDVMGETGSVSMLVQDILVPGGLAVVNGNAYVAETQQGVWNSPQKPKPFRLVKVDLPSL